MTQYKKLGMTLAGERERRNKTQADVARYLGISYQAVSGWERGERKIDSVSLLRLLLWLDVDIYDFLDRCGFEVMHRINSTTPVLERRLLDSFYSLNSVGQEEACERLEEMLSRDKYTDNLNPAASDTKAV